MVTQQWAGVQRGMWMKLPSERNTLSGRKIRYENPVKRSEVERKKIENTIK